MIVQCDKCHQQFDVPDAILQPSGRNLKCANCGKLFFQAAPEFAAGDAGDIPGADVKVSEEVTEEAEHSVKVLQTSDAPGLPVEEDPDLPDEARLAHLLEDLQAAHPEDAHISQEEEGDWATHTDALEEIDIDGDPELSALEALEAGAGEAAGLDETEAVTRLAETDDLEQEPDAAAIDATEATDGLEQEPEPDAAAAIDETEAATRLAETDDLEQEPAAAAAMDETEAATPLAEADHQTEGAAMEEPLAQDRDEELATQLVTQAGHMEAGALDDEAATLLATRTLLAEEPLEEEDEDALIAAVKAGHPPLGQTDLLAEGKSPWPDEEPWTVRGDTVRPPPAVTDPSGKMEPQFDAPLAKGAEGDKAAKPVAKGAAQSVSAAAAARKKRVAAANGAEWDGLTKKLWVAAAVLLVVTVGMLVRTDWWEYTWFNWHSPYRLSTLETSWRKQSFGHVLLVQGEVTNNGGSSAPPWVQVSLLDGQNKTLLTAQVVPGRVVDRRILDGSGEQAVSAIIHLQGQERTPSESTWTAKQVPFQVIFINPPGEAVRFQVDLNGTGQVAAQQKSQKTGAMQL
ncbi:MAG: zinc-ribbon domain-containing protein [Magnetococcales bacterium]|nr:zinc-ribbon domain-containing protein [Magnetococcales bacterium]